MRKGIREFAAYGARFPTLVAWLLLSAITVHCSRPQAGPTSAASKAGVTGLPANLIYPGAQVVGSDSGRQGGSERLYTFHTDDSLDEVAAHYERQLAGWVQAVNIATPEVRQLVCTSRTGGQRVTLTLANPKSRSGTDITIGYSIHSE